MAWKLSMLLLAAAIPMSPAFAEGPITGPITYVWIAEPCADWPCAVSALVSAHAVDTLILPTARETIPWIVLKRIPSGAVSLPPDHPLEVECFTTFAEASARFASIPYGRQPILLTLPNGTVMVTCFTTEIPQRRRVRPVT